MPLSAKEVQILNNYMDCLRYDAGYMIYGNNRYGRLCIYSCATNEVVTYSWLKTNLDKYLGLKLHKKIASFTDEYRFEDSYMFHCKRYGNIYIVANHLDDIYNSALKHKDYKTAELINKAISDRDNLIETRVGNGTNKSKHREIYLKAS
jgi:hypothetical protein